MINSVITGSGAYFPTRIVRNEDFLEHRFYHTDGTPIHGDQLEIVNKLKDITGIRERRYAEDDLRTSDIAAIAAQRAIDDAGVDPETIDQIIVAHNFGDILAGTLQTDIVPSIASRVKHSLGIRNIHCVPYDLIFGCPGWIQGLIQADAFFRAGIAKKALVIGAETLSRIVDPHDRDSMIFADGAGATVLEAREEKEKRGILSTAVIAHAQEDIYFLYMDRTNNPHSHDRHRYIKMLGRKIYEYALKYVPEAMKECLQKAGIDHVEDVKKIFIHQANEKMDDAIVQRLFRLYKIREHNPLVVPMNIHDFGNSSVATIPTLYDMVYRGQLEGHALNPGDLILFASVGAGMNINAVAYKC